MQAADVVKVSTKGQIVIPKEVRKRFGIEPGERLLVAMGRNGILLKKAEEISLHDIGLNLSKAARREKVDVDTLVEDALKWARKSR